MRDGYSGSFPVVLLGYKTSVERYEPKTDHNPVRAAGQHFCTVPECARQSGQSGFAVTRTDASWRKRLRCNKCQAYPIKPVGMVDGHSAIRTFTSKFLWKFHSRSGMQSEPIRIAFLFELPEIWECWRS